ncbi:MAG: TonB-dependent receptor [Porticoccaceae bacterium]
MKRFNKKSTYVSLAVSAFLAAGSAIAEIEEITVTATKRAQSLQDVPLTVSVTSQETIQKSSIVDLIDLQTAVPSLRVNQLQSSAQTNFAIRGFGNGANNPGIEPAVLVLIDGVPRSRSSSSLADLPNLERVEVLSGPQSTLFGKNASAGVISITTKAPEGEFGGLIETTVGNYGTQIVKGTVTGPLADNLSYRVSASSNENDGYGVNLMDNSPLNNRDRSAFRAQLAWDVSDDLSIRLIADNDEIDEACCVTGPLRQGPATQASNALADGNVLAADASPWDYQIFMNADDSPYNRLENEGYSIHIDYDLGFAKLTSITSDRATDMAANFDPDFSGARLLRENKLNYDFDTFTQELRLRSNDDSEIQWSVGAFYSEEDTKSARTVLYGEGIKSYANILLEQLAGTTLDGAALAYGVAPVNVNVETNLNDYLDLLARFGQAQILVGAAVQAGLAPDMGTVSLNADDFFLSGTGDDAGGSTQENFDMTAKTLSLFANVEFPVADDWTASIGLNKTKDEKHVKADVVIEDVFAAQPWELLSQDLNAFKFFPPFTPYPESGRDFDSDDLTHTLRLTHEYSDNTNVYISHSTGFKPTSVNLSVNATSPDTRAADPEHSENIEIGMKHSHETGYLNIALFNQNIQGFQSNTFVGTGFQLVNAGDQRHQGLEFDLKQQLSDNWLLGLSAIKIDAEYQSFVNGPCETVTEGMTVFPSIACDVDENGLRLNTKDLSGTKPAGISDWSANLNATYSFNVSDAVSSFLRLEYVYESEVAVVDNVPAVISPVAHLSPLIAGNIPAVRSTKNFNMSMGFTHNPSGIEVMLWGRNLTNHESLLSAFPTTAAPGSYGGYPNAPRTYGLTARATF